MKKKVYLDYASTAPTSSLVVDHIYKNLKNIWGNSSSVHEIGRLARAKLEDARDIMSNSINAENNEIIFTSGGTESNNNAIQGIASAYKKNGNHIITTKIEHLSVINPIKKLEKNGFNVTYLDVDKNGLIDIKDLENALKDDTILVSIGMLNNEVGSSMPISTIGNLLKNHQAVFHTDAVQSYGLIDIDVKEDNIDLLSTSAHKQGGPKMTGFLYKSNKIKLDSLILGGNQELGHRSGTQNVSNIAAWGSLMEQNNYGDAKRKNYKNLKNILISYLEDMNIDFDINGFISSNHIINIWIKGYSSDIIQINLDLMGVYVSAGSACTAGSLQKSHVLSSMYYNNDNRVVESIRISFGDKTTEDDIKYLCESLRKVLDKLKKEVG